MRLLGLLFLPAFGLASAALAESPRTTRIETRPYYGAVVTIEHGVRVYRPVPPTQHLIINPEGASPLQLNVGEGANFAPQAVGR
ncbi:MAG: hypothetical protein ABI457_13765 [Hyphomicrobium sp.]